MEHNKQLLDENEVAELFKLKPKTLAMWRSRCEGPKFIKVSNQTVRYRLEDIQEFLSARVVETKDAD